MVQRGNLPFVKWLHNYAKGGVNNDALRSLIVNSTDLVRFSKILNLLKHGNTGMHLAVISG
jgi:hypothetical protein